MFTGHISAGARHADQPGVGRRIDDGPLALGEHMRNLGFHAQPDPRQVNGNDALPVLLRAVNRALRLAGYAGIIMRAVQAAIGLDRRIDQRFYLSRLRDIGLHKDRLPARALNQANRFLPAFDNNIGNDHLGAFTRKGQGRLSAYA